MTTETLQRVDNQERLQASSEMAGLQGRLVLAAPQYLNPDNELSAEDVMQIASFEARDYNVFDKTSTFDRNTYWQQHTENEDFQAMYGIWSSQLVDQLNRHPQEKLAKFFKHIGIDTATTNTQFIHQHAGIIYERYFSDTQTENTGIKYFVSDMLTTYQTNGTIDYRQLEQLTSEIKWFANIFGIESSEIVTQLIFAEAKLLTQPDIFRAKLTEITTNSSGTSVMRINNLSNEEIHILDYIGEANLYEDTLPILKYREEIKQQILNGQSDSVIILGGTGSGKTTETPKIIREIMKPGEKLIVTEPRQINTELLAGRVADDMGMTVGQEIGYHHGDKNNFNNETDTIFMTEKILVLMLLNNDPLLKNLSYVMLDEIHIQSTDTELLLALLREEQERRKNANPALPPLKIIAVSATADKVKLQQYFDNKSAIEVEGKMHHVEVNFSNEPIPSKQLPVAAATKVREILNSEKSQEGDIVITVAGKADIRKVVSALKAKGINDGSTVKIIPIHRDSQEIDKQEIGIKATPGVRRIIIATNYIETGVTINGLKYLINCGERFNNFIDPASGLVYVTRALQSQSEITQWEGRVGRIENGIIEHLFTRNHMLDPNSYVRRPEYPLAEMERSDLTEMVLLLKSKGRDIRNYKFLSTMTPEQRAAFIKRVEFSEETLKILGALDPHGNITTIGENMSEIRADFHSARMIIASKEAKKGIAEVCTIAALKEEKSLFNEKEARKRYNTINSIKDSDFMTYLHIWQEFEKNGMSQDWAVENNISYSALMRAQSKRNKLLKGNPIQAPATPEEIKRFVFEGYKDRLMHFHQNPDLPDQKRYLWERNKAISFTLLLDDNSAVTNTPDYIIAADNSAVKPETSDIYLSNCESIDWNLS